MKKLTYFLPVAIAAIGLASCGNNKQDPATDSDSIADTAAIVAADTTAVDTTAVAPTPADTITATVDPEKDLTLTVQKKNLKWVPEGETKQGSWTVKVTNKGNSDIKGSEYVVAYTEIIEDTNRDGDLVEVSKKRTEKGLDVAPGASVEIILKAKPGCLDFKNPKIKAAK